MKRTVTLKRGGNPSPVLDRVDVPTTDKGLLAIKLYKLANKHFAQLLMSAGF